MNNIYSFENMQALNSYLYDEFALTNMYWFCDTLLHSCWMCTCIQSDIEDLKQIAVEEIKDSFLDNQKPFKYKWII